MADWRTLEARLPFRFKDRELLRQALVHTSYLNENPGIGVGSNERSHTEHTRRVTFDKGAGIRTPD